MTDAATLKQESVRQEENDENQSIKSNSSNANGTADSENGVWLLVTSTMGLTLGYVRIDDHDHELTLSEIRDMITDKLMTNAEYTNGFSFGLGWPLTPVKETEENNVFAKDVLPSVSVLSIASANNLQIQTNPMSAAAAMQYGMMGNNMNWSALQSGNSGNLQPLPISSVFTPISSQYYPQQNDNNNQSASNNGLKTETFDESDQNKASAESKLSNSSNIPSLPPFSPPTLSPEQLAEKAKEQKKKLQNLLPQKNDNKRSSPNHSDNKTKAKKAKVNLPRLKAMDRDGQVIEAPKEEIPKKTKIANPTSEQQKALYCPGCDKKFTKERGYKQHMNKKHGITLVRGRNKERRFHCEQTGCTRSFYQRSDLRRHQRVHLGVKPFKCSLCHKEFTQRGSLYRHVTSSHKSFKGDKTECCVVQTSTTMPNGAQKTNAMQRPEALDKDHINTNSAQNDDENNNNNAMAGLYELPPSVNQGSIGNTDIVMRMHQRMPPPLIPMKDEEMK